MSENELKAVFVKNIKYAQRNSCNLRELIEGTSPIHPE